MTNSTAKNTPLHLVGSEDKRPPGRAPGLGKVVGSGRKKGVPNKITTDVKETILKRGRPLELLCDVARGIKIRVGAQAGPEKVFVYPTLPDRIRAAETLLSKIVPSVKASEISGPDGAPLIPIEPQQSSRQTARALLTLLGTGVVAAPDESNDDEQPNSDTPGISPSRGAALTEGSEVWAPADPSTSSNGPTCGTPSPEIGESHRIGTAGASIQLVKITPDGRERWKVFGGDGEDWGGVWGKEAAQAKAQQLVAERRI